MLMFPSFYLTDDIEPLKSYFDSLCPVCIDVLMAFEPLFKGRRQRGCRHLSRPFDGSRMPKWERQEERLSLPPLKEGRFGGMVGTLLR